MKRSSLIILIIVIVGFIALSFIIPQKYFLNPIKSAFLTVFSPIERAFSSASFGASNFFEKIGRIRDLSGEVEKLQAENQKLISEKISWLEIQKENEILKKQLEFSASNPEFHQESAKIIGRDPNNLLQYFTISKGENDGIKVDMPVIYEGFLVGKISEVTQNTSKVFLITNPSSVVNAMVQRSRATGLIRGQLGYGIILENIPQDAEVEKGDYVITSGLGNIPKGLIVGQVDQVESIQSALFQKAILKPLIDFTKIEMVFVIKN